MKTLVVYRSHYGSTRRYAQWLAQALDADAAEERQADARLVQNYECVIFGGGLYAGSIAGAARMAKLYGALQGKRLAMFTVGLSDPSDPENVKKIMQDAARAMNYSDSYFCKLFKQCFDQNFTTYLTDVRIREAKRLLADQGMSVRDVGLNVGYGDSRYFSRVFKRMTGMLPSEYRDRHYAQK